MIPAEAVARFWSRVDKAAGPDGCWEWRGTTQHFGHGLLSVGGVNLKVHRISYEMHTGPIPHGLCVRHRCDNPPCVNPAHLELGTRADNNRDRDLRGRQVAPVGEAHGMHKLTDAEVATIRRLADERIFTRAAIARQFGISQGYLYVLIRGQKRKVAA